MNDYIQVRIDKEDKDKASQIFEDIGIDISTAIRMFLKKSIKVNGLPFSVNDYEELDYLSAMDTILEMKAEAEKNGCQNITLEEINKVIDDYRINKKEF